MFTKITKKNIENYLITNNGYIKHNTNLLIKAIKETSKKYQINEIDLFLFYADNKPINKLFTHSYGFHTREGRELANDLQNNYEKLENDIFSKCIYEMIQTDKRQNRNYSLD
jgi:hypothetical protein